MNQICHTENGSYKLLRNVGTNRIHYTVFQQRRQSTEKHRCDSLKNASLSLTFLLKMKAARYFYRPETARLSTQLQQHRYDTHTHTVGESL